MNNLAIAPLRLGIEQGDLLVVEMVSLYHGPVKLDDLILSMKGYLRSQNRPFRKAQLDDQLARLVADGRLLKRGLDRLECHPDLAEDVTAQMVLAGRLEAGAAHLVLKKARNSWGYYDQAADRAIQKRDARLALYRDQRKGSHSNEPLAGLGLAYRNPDSLRAVPAGQRTRVLAEALETAVEHWQKPPACLAFLESEWAAQSSLDPLLVELLAEQWIMQGRLDPVLTALTRHPELCSLRGCLDFLKGQYEDARRCFEKARQRSDSKFFRSKLTGVFYILCLIRAQDWEGARWYLRGDFSLRSIEKWLAWLVESRAGSELRHAPAVELDRTNPAKNFWIGLITTWERYMTGPNLETLFDELPVLAAQAGYHWIESQANLMLSDEETESPLLNCLPPSQRWRQALSALLEAGKPVHLQSGAERLVWVLSPEGRPEPKLQKPSQRGGWTAGRVVRWDDAATCASEVDRRAMKAMREAEPEAILPSLVGHPLVFRQGDLGQPIELVAGEPELQVQRLSDFFHIQLKPTVQSKSGIGLIRESRARLKVVKFTEKHRRMAHAIGPDGLLVPAEEETCLQELVGSLSATLPITSDLAVGSSLVEVEPDSTLCLRIRPCQQGLDMQLLVRPLGRGGPEFQPGRGGRSVLARVEGKTLQTIRDVPEELRREQVLLHQCPILERSDDGCWRILDAHSCLLLLEQLAACAQDPPQIEWPEGQPLRIAQSLSWDQMRLSAKGTTDWLEVSGELELDDGKVLQMSQLLDLVRAGQGRFLPLEPGRFVALTEEFRRRLEEMADFGERDRSGRLRFHPLAAGCLEEWPQLQADSAFRARLEKLRQAEELHVQPPSTLQAELRGYQAEGFEWLAQRAHWGVGACLADDMGLGKTVQALALLVFRAPEGPSLVIAPTSVCGNWAAEAARFAPTLKVHLLGEGDRQAMLSQAGPFDLVVASYGLLVNEIDKLSEPAWQTVILDEAQAIKNTHTRRFQCALRLSAQLRLATTGTPVENRLEELWALFRFLNPGLLGSLERFRSRFVAPIEGGDLEKRDRLRRLVRPFLLRRTKGQVLQELPARTEVLLEVDLTEQERAFYEALRLQALKQLAGPQVQPLNILAELTRLRRACCHPRLVLATFKSQGGSKLQVLSQLLDEMQQGGHRALVFSQFVDHLSMLREHLEQQRICYQYLDGGTPAQERTRRVAAFQAGQGEVFLISLRAGGLGLNLTGADYVIHMDPWWNPAVEDQASDRAHRFGQLRPVTIYRLVARHTVEEKIVALHRQKRDLAESLLEGAETGVRLSAAELLRLIHDD